MSPGDVLFDPNPELCWLFCMTHPDDEISICAWIRDLAQAGAKVYLSWTHATPTRREEAVKAAALLGVPGEHLFFHRGTDGQICDELSALLPGFEKMVGEANPDRVCCGAFEQGHLDHDATNMLVNSVFKGPVLEIPFYHTYLTRRPIVNRFAQPEAQEIRLLNAEAQCLKLRFSRMYPSQRIYLNLFLAEARRVLTAWSESPLKATERMRVQTHFDFLTPNLPEPMARRVLRSAKWRRWESAARAIL